MAGATRARGGARSTAAAARAARGRGVRDAGRAGARAAASTSRARARPCAGARAGHRRPRPTSARSRKCRCAWRRRLNRRRGGPGTSASGRAVVRKKGAPAPRRVSVVRGDGSRSAPRAPRGGRARRRAVDEALRRSGRSAVPRSRLRARRSSPSPAHRRSRGGAGAGQDRGADRRRSWPSWRARGANGAGDARRPAQGAGGAARRCRRRATTRWRARSSSSRRRSRISGAARCWWSRAGTSDLPVAEEAALTARLLGNRVERLYDVGVAGIHRLLAQARAARGGERDRGGGRHGGRAAVGGRRAGRAPVIAVPTSVGYGASFGGHRGAARHAQLVRRGRDGGEHRQRLRRGLRGGAHEPQARRAWVIERCAAARCTSTASPGIAGDMTLGALLDLGVPEEVVRAELREAAARRLPAVRTSGCGAARSWAPRCTSIRSAARASERRDDATTMPHEHAIHDAHARSRHAHAHDHAHAARARARHEHEHRTRTIRRSTATHPARSRRQARARRARAPHYRDIRRC